MRPFALALAVLAGLSSEAMAEWQFKPSIGVTFGGDTTLLDFGEGPERQHTSFGGSVTVLGEVVGVEADFSYIPGFFEPSSVVVRSSALSLSGNVVVALPRRIAGYSLRPYAVGGFGMLRARTEDLVDALSIRENLPAFNVGGGVTGFLTERLGVNWDLRYFRSLGQPEGGSPTSIGSPQLSFWRVNMALAIRY